MSLTLTSVRAVTAALLLIMSGAALPAKANAATPCPPPQAPVLVGDTGVALEGAVVDRRGRLYATDLFGGRVLRFDRPGGTYTVRTGFAAGHLYRAGFDGKV